MDRSSPPPPHEVLEVCKLEPSNSDCYTQENPRDDDGTLESIVNQATRYLPSPSCMEPVVHHDEPNELTMTTAYILYPHPVSRTNFMAQAMNIRTFPAGNTKEVDKNKKKKGRGSSSSKKWAGRITTEGEDWIDQRIKTLQKLVPNSTHKTDEASILDEVIKYIKQLQSQVQMMMRMRQMTVPYTVMHPMAMQQALPTSMMGRAISPHPFHYRNHHPMPQIMTSETYNKMVALYHQLYQSRPRSSAP